MINENIALHLLIYLFNVFFLRRRLFISTITAITCELVLSVQPTFAAGQQCESIIVHSAEIRPP